MRIAPRQPPAALTQDEMRDLARTDPSALIRLLRSDAELHALSSAAEIAGGIADSTLVVGALLELVRHPSAPVREGAIYGLARHLSIEVRRVLEELEQADPSPAVRRAAADVLDE